MTSDAQIGLGKEESERLDYTTYLRSCTACGGERPWNILNVFREGNSIIVEAQCPGCETIIPADIVDDESLLSGGRRVDPMATGDKCWQCFEAATGQDSEGKDVCANHGGPQEASLVGMTSEAPDASQEDSPAKAGEEGSSDEEATAPEATGGEASGDDSEGTPA